MGEAEVDLQPLITSTLALGDPNFFSEMQVSKWLKAKDNILIKHSTIHVVNGKLKQEVSLKLRNVERGEIDLEFEWFPLTQ